MRKLHVVLTKYNLHHEPLNLYRRQWTHEKRKKFNESPFKHFKWHYQLVSIVWTPGGMTSSTPLQSSTPPIKEVPETWYSKYMKRKREWTKACKGGKPKKNWSTWSC